MQAMKGFTIDAAYAAFQEDQVSISLLGNRQLGSIEAGKHADFVVTTRNFFDIEDESDWLEVSIEKVFVSGQLRFLNN
jgi:predicted amidohydrolase YtcJ